MQDLQLYDCKIKRPNQPPVGFEALWRSLQNNYENFYIDFVNTTTAAKQVQIGIPLYANEFTYNASPLVSYTDLSASVTINGIFYNNTFPSGLSTPNDLIVWLNGLSVTTDIYEWTFNTNGINNIYNCKISQGSIIGNLFLFYTSGIDEDIIPVISNVFYQDSGVTVLINGTETLQTFTNSQSRYRMQVKYLFIEATTAEQAEQSIYYNIRNANGIMEAKNIVVTREQYQASSNKVLCKVDIVMDSINEVVMNILPNQAAKIRFYYLPNKIECFASKVKGIETSYEIPNTLPPHLRGRKPIMTQSVY